MNTDKKINESYEKILQEALKQKKKDFEEYVKEGLADEAKKTVDKYNKTKKNVEGLLKDFKGVLNRHNKTFKGGPDIGLVQDLQSVESELRRIMSILKERSI
jgi:hypothetical protein